MTGRFVFPPGIRDLIREALPEDTSLHGGIPQVRYTYLPGAHSKSLRPDNMLVVGIRGAGKSYWWGALQNEEHRKRFGSSIGMERDPAVSVGFGETPKPLLYPSKDTLRALLEGGAEARIIWKTVVFWQLWSTHELKGALNSVSSWKDRVEWVRQNPEIVENKTYELDRALEQEGRYHLVLFDALDRTADDWKTMNQLVRGLLQTTLDFRPSRRIRLKVFLRPDQLEDPEVGAFPDASKILSRKTELYWPRNELYAMLWQYLANADGGGLFRDHVKRHDIVWQQEQGVWVVPKELIVDEGLQRMVFHAFTGEWMGRDRRRGFPYTWLPNHLGDTRNQVSPRSFLAAVRHAASDPPRSDYGYPIHYESIKSGVRQASKIRVAEIQEDYPWVQGIFSSLSSVSVPCSIEEVKRIWQNNRVLENLSAQIECSTVRLPPAHIGEGPDGVLRDLRDLGLIEPLSQGRINIPDVYRVGFGMGRRGGVKPAARPVSRYDSRVSMVDGKHPILHLQAGRWVLGAPPMVCAAHEPSVDRSVHSFFRKVWATPICSRFPDGRSTCRTRFPFRTVRVPLMSVQSVSSPRSGPLISL